MRRLKLYHLFFLSTLKINVPLSLLACLLISKGDWIIYFDALPYMLGGVGVITSLLYKEVMEKEAYYFYYNSGKAWIPEKNQEKLDRLLEQEAARKKFLKLLQR